MPGAFVQQNNGTSLLANPATAAWGSTTTLGYWILINSANGSGITDYLTTPSGGGVTTWTKAISSVASSIDMECWYGKVTTAGTTGPTLGFSLASASRLTWCMQEVSGLDPTAPFDKAGAAAGGTSTTPLSGATGTLAQADSYLVGAVGWGSSTTTASAGASYSNVGQDGSDTTAPRWCAHESKVVAVTTSDTAGFTLAASRAWACIVTAWIAAAAGGPITKPVPAAQSPAVARSSRW